MTSARHTPGPWQVTGEMDRFHQGEVIRPLDADGRPGSPVAVVCDFNRYDRDAEREANAHLIAATPDLEDAARFALSVLRANPVELSERLAIEKLEAAIALAEGRGTTGDKPRP
jgi:hypothetical protein